MTRKIAIIGATGAVGRKFVQLLLEIVKPEKLLLLASKKSAGSSINISGRNMLVQDVSEASFSEVSLAFFSAGAEVSRKYAPKAEIAGAWVIDNSSAFRATHPLVVPEINLATIKNRGIIANPNCAVIPLCLVLHQLAEFDINKVDVVTFQSVSGSGHKGLSALAQGGVSEVYSAPIAGNIIPKIDDYLDNGYTKEEMKIVTETNKILGKNLSISPTAVRVPVQYGHSLAVHIQAKNVWNLSRVYELLSCSSSIKIVPDSEILTPRTHVEFCPGVMVSRIRIEYDNPNGLLFWLVSDNLKKGAALNSVQIAQKLGLLQTEEGVVGCYG